MLSVTTEAQQKLREVLDAEYSNGNSIRVTVVRGPHGCVHGWQLAVEDGPEVDDAVFAAGPVLMLVEPELAELLEGATIGYRQDSQGIGFTIDAPNPPPMGHGHEHGDGGVCYH